MRLHGFAAIEYAEKEGMALNGRACLVESRSHNLKEADILEEARESLS